MIISLNCYLSAVEATLLRTLQAPASLELSICSFLREDCPVAFLNYTGKEWTRQTRSPTTLFIPTRMADKEANSVVEVEWDLALTKYLVTDTYTLLYKKTVSMFISSGQTLCTLIWAGKGIPDQTLVWPWGR